MGLTRSLFMSDAAAGAGAPGLQYMQLYDVRSYGARGDGVHDDGPALQAAISAANAAGGGIVGLWPGTYLDKSVTLFHLPNVILWGLGGRGSVTLKAGNGLNKTLLQFPGGAGPYSNAQIRNITFDQNGSNQTATTQLQFNRVTDFLMEQCTVINPWDIALRFADASTGPYENVRPVLRDCLFDGSGQVHPVDLVDFGSSQDAGVERCAFVNCAASANGALSSAYTSGLLVDGCIFRGNANWALSIQGADGARVRDCLFYANVGQGAIQLTPWSTSAPYTALTNTVIARCQISGSTVGVQIAAAQSTVSTMLLEENVFTGSVTADITLANTGSLSLISILGGAATGGAVPFVSQSGGTVASLRCDGVRNFNPRGGAVVTPAFPAASGTWVNNLGVDVLAIITANGATGVGPAVSDCNGANFVTFNTASPIFIPAGATFKVAAYAGGPPTWVMWGS